MKALLKSGKPKQLVNILNGKASLLITKSIPKDFVGWVYLYCTKAKPYLYKGGYRAFHTLDRTNPFNYIWSLNNKKYTLDLQNGKVVARFWFDDYIEIKMEKEYVSNWLTPYVYRYNVPQELLNKMCLTNKQLEDYSPDIKGNDVYDMKLPTLYAWHIKNLEIFDKPKELREFCKVGYNEQINRLEFYKEQSESYPSDIMVVVGDSEELIYERHKITKAPQNYCYCEVIE